jgi:hypothetical protein
VLSCLVLPCDCLAIALDLFVLCCLVLTCVVLFYLVLSVLCFVLCCVVLCRVALCRVVLCFVAMLCFCVVLSCVVSYFAMFYLPNPATVSFVFFVFCFLWRFSIKCFFLANQIELQSNQKKKKKKTHKGVFLFF